MPYFQTFTLFRVIILSNIQYWKVPVAFVISKQATKDFPTRIETFEEILYDKLIFVSNLNLIEYDEK